MFCFGIISVTSLYDLVLDFASDRWEACCVNIAISIHISHNTGLYNLYSMREHF